ncbi:MAG: class I tRNA ligase family protein [bacterium]|nr:class I tRNA ligase family protein [bacterium]
MKLYHHEKIEKKWQKQWLAEETYKASDNKVARKFYHLVMFAYPSGDLHIGHWYNFAPADVVARKKRMEGLNVLSPFGFDAFGLPAENAAIKRKLHPKEWTYANIDRMRGQLESMGPSYDWSRQVITADPEYYTWTQWMFLQLYKKGLAYRAEVPANWCPSCKTVLANEQVVDGACERCKTIVVQKNIEQWMFKITAYADELLRNLDALDWPERTKTMQRNWIGRSEGARIKFKLHKSQTAQITNPDEIEVFTTRPDTIFGATYLVLAPEHPFVTEQLLENTNHKSQITNAYAVKSYIDQAAKKTEIERTSLEKEKTGVELEGIKAINPATGQEIPLWVADYVLGHYGTGAIMAVPAHDQRDYEFAEKFGLPKKIVIEPVCGDPRPDEEYRLSIVAIVEDRKTGKLLSINWGRELGGNLFVGGGRENGEDPIQCALREIEEETGYHRLTPTSSTEAIYHHYRAHSKNKNRLIEAIGLHFYLEDGDQKPVKLEEDEKGKFTVEWLTKDEARAKVKDPLHRLVFDRLVEKHAYAGEGMMVDSGEFTGLESGKALPLVIGWMEKAGWGMHAITYKLHDWIVSRQRYWGAPIPVIYCAQCAINDGNTKYEIRNTEQTGNNIILRNGKKYAVIPVPPDQLPVRLPDIDDYTPPGDGKSPLARSEAFTNVQCPECGKPAKRETDTMDTFVDSSWYFLRYTDPHNAETFASKENVAHWLPVDLYIGGAEHSVMHLLYARFFTMALADMGWLHFREPFAALRHQGIILGPDGEKMSKSRGNVIDPDSLVKNFGADTVRMYLCFMSEYSQGGPWSPGGINGVHRFLQRVWKWYTSPRPSPQKGEGDFPPPRGGIEGGVFKTLHKTIKKVGEDIDTLKFNTAISALMICFRQLEEATDVSAETREIFLKLLAPFAPFITEELWREQLGHASSIHREPWPTYDPSSMEDESVSIAVQIGGKTRGAITAPKDADEANVRVAVHADPRLQKYLEGKEVKKTVFVKNRLINILVA